MPRGKQKAVEPATEQATKFRKVIDDGADELVCPITHELPVDPVTAEDGRVYERSAIEEWLGQHEKSPHTNEPMGTKLLPATQVKNLIASMVRSGAISGDKAGAWTKKLEGEKEVEEMRQKAEAGDAEAMMSLADWYQDGTNGLQKNLSERYKWAKRAADLDHAEGISDVGWCAFFGEGTEQNRALGNVLCAGGHHGAGSRVLPVGGQVRQRRRHWAAQGPRACPVLGEEGTRSGPREAQVYDGHVPRQGRSLGGGKL